jgi:hypothetical protein
LEQNPFALDADVRLEELEDQVEGLDDVLEELRDDGVPPENLDKIEKVRNFIEISLKFRRKERN